MTSPHTQPPAGLGEVIGRPGWVTLADRPDSTIAMYPWPDGSVDSITAQADGTGHIERTNPGGEPVWRRKGDLSYCLREFGALPAPMAPGAPREVLDGSPHNADRNM